MSQTVYDQAVALYLQSKIYDGHRKFPDHTKFADIDFYVEDNGPGCDTCGWGGGQELVIEFKYDRRWHTYNLQGITPGQFLHEASEKLKELPLYEKPSF